MTERVREKFKPFIKGKGGIFTSATRKRLLKISPGRPGWSENSADFRYNVREYVKQALLDLELFIEVVDEKDVNEILNRETIMPITEALFHKPIIENEKPNSTRADIAQLFIQYGFDYLSMMKIHDFLQLHSRVVTEAIELSLFLVKSFKVEDQQ